jgi:hypothetical protein
MDLSRLLTKRKISALLILIPIILTACQRSEKDIAYDCRAKAFDYYEQHENNTTTNEQAQTIYIACMNKAGVTNPSYSYWMFFE